MIDMVNHPPHYTSHPSGVETIEITENLDFCLGNAVKYVTRYNSKGKPVEDLEKAMFYLNKAKDRHDCMFINPTAVGDSVVEWSKYEENELVKLIVCYACIYLAEGTYSDIEAAIAHLQTLLSKVRANG